MWGPYQDNEIVKKIDLSKKVRYAAITNKPNPSQAQLLAIKWSYSINGGEKTDFKTKVEWSRDEDKNRAIMEFDPPESWEGKEIKVYAFYRGESEEVAQKGIGSGIPVVKTTNSSNNFKGTDSSPQLIWGNRVSVKFEQKVLAICKELWGEKRKFEMANGLMAVMKVETWGSFKPQHLEGETKSRDVNTMTIESFYKKGNPKSSRAVGLIQFTQDALEALGDFPKSTKQNQGTQQRFDELNKKKLEYAKMSDLDQLNKVRDYLAISANRAKSPSDIYLQVFAPIGLERDGNPVLYKTGSDGYTSNQSMDTNTKDGGITKNELLARYWKSYEEGLKNKKGKSTTPTKAQENTPDDDKTDEPETGTFNAKDVATFRTYHDGRIELHYPKVIKPEYAKKVKYIYITAENKEYDICTLDWFEIDKIKYSSKWTQAIPKGYIDHESFDIDGVNQKEKYIYSDGSVIASGLPGEGKGTLTLKYVKAGGKARMIKIPEPFVFNKDSIKFNFKFEDTIRKYMSRSHFAALIGALISGKFSEIVSTGSAMSDGTCFPSKGHVNGESLDTDYLSNANTQKYIDLMAKFGFNRFLYSPSLDFTNPKPNDSNFTFKKDAAHRYHLHAGSPLITVKIINEK
ncbi:MAG: hypothetical protein ACO1N0_12660 [Fluviicola sp.]